MGRPVPGPAVDHAQRAEGLPVGVDQRDARVGDDPDVADRGVVAQHVVLACVVDHQRLAARDRVLAEGMAQRSAPLGRPRLRQAEAALEELPIGVHQRDERHGRVEHVRGDAGEAVERRRDVRVEEPGRVHGLEPVGVLDRRGRLEQRLPALHCPFRGVAGSDGALVRRRASSMPASPRWPMAYAVRMMVASRMNWAALTPSRDDFALEQLPELLAESHGGRSHRHAAESIALASDSASDTAGHMQDQLPARTRIRHRLGIPPRDARSCSHHRALVAPSSSLPPAGRAQTTGALRQEPKDCVSMSETTEVLEWRGRTAVDREGDKLGTIEEIYLDAETQRPEWALIKTGMFGGKSTFMPLEGSTSAGDQIEAPSPSSRSRTPRSRTPTASSPRRTSPPCTRTTASATTSRAPTAGCPRAAPPTGDGGTSATTPAVPRPTTR